MNIEDNMKNGVWRKEINVGGVVKNNNVDMEVDRLLNYEVYKIDGVRSYKENYLVVLLVLD